MIELDIRPLLNAQDLLTQWSAIITNREPPRPIRQDEKNEMTRWLEPIAAHFLAHNFEMCSAQIDRLFGIFRTTSNPDAILSEINDLRRRILDQSSLIYCLSLSRRERDFYDAKEPRFGKDVAAKFLGVAYEIDEAGKCIALERSTAAAFHAIRCLEGGIRALSRCLVIPDPTRASDRNWGAILKSLKDEIDKRWPGSSTRLHGDGQFFDNAYAALAAIQNPWRNATMHLDQKYTLDEAQNIFEVVKGFMTRLASRCDENGDPKA